VKIRFGVGLGADTGPDRLAGVVDQLEAAGIDSLWFSELVYTRAVDPFVGMAYALGRTTRLKVGTSVAILPGRHPVLVAKQLASLAALAPKRVLPVFGLTSAIPAERDLFVVPEGKRAEVFDEALRLLRNALEADGAFDGEHYAVRALAVAPRPDPPLDIWLGGSAPAAFRRIGRLADGWLGSFVTASEAREARDQIERAATEAVVRSNPTTSASAWRCATARSPTTWPRWCAGADPTSTPPSSSPRTGRSCTARSTTTWRPA
jgi:probable F420-dependent oxidoreductase